MGAGPHDLLMGVFGAHPGRVYGEVEIEGREFASRVLLAPLSIAGICHRRFESGLV